MSAAPNLEAKIDLLLEEVRELRRRQDLTARVLHTRASAARILKVKRSEIEAAVTAGLIRTVPGTGKRPRIPLDEIERIARDGMPAQKRRGRPRKKATDAANNPPTKLSDWRPGS